LYSFPFEKNVPAFYWPAQFGGFFSHLLCLSVGWISCNLQANLFPNITNAKLPGIRNTSMTSQFIFIFVRLRYTYNYDIFFKNGHNIVNPTFFIPLASLPLSLTNVAETCRERSLGSKRNSTFFIFFSRALLRIYSQNLIFQFQYFL